jgi:hypothetical protein
MCSEDVKWDTLAMLHLMQNFVNIMLKLLDLFTHNILISRLVGWKHSMYHFHEYI